MIIVSGSVFRPKVKEVVTVSVSKSKGVREVRFDLDGAEAAFPAGGVTVPTDAAGTKRLTVRCDFLPQDPNDPTVATCDVTAKGSLGGERTNTLTQFGGVPTDAVVLTFNVEAA